MSGKLGISKQPCRECYTYIRQCDILNLMIKFDIIVSFDNERNDEKSFNWLTCICEEPL